MKNQERRNFLRIAGIGLAAGMTAPRLLASESFRQTHAEKTASVMPELSLASYTTREFSLDETLVMVKRLNLKHLGLKSFHLPLDASEATCKEAAAKIKSAGIDFYSAGVIYLNKLEEVEQAFNYARACGIRMIICSPAHEMLPVIEERVKQFNIVVAIHNHGPGDTLNPTVPGIYDRIRNMDRRIGICMDIGHVVRLNEDPASQFRQCFDRIVEVHIKDTDKRTAEGGPVEIGRGVIDIPAFLKVVVELQYAGFLSFEYEKDGKDPLPGLAESVGYVRGVMATL